MSKPNRSLFPRCHNQPQKRYKSAIKKTLQQTTLSSKQTTQSTNHKLFNNSFNETFFNKAKKDNETILKDSECCQNLLIHHTKNSTEKETTGGFYLLHNKSGKIFINIIHKHFPLSITFHKIFNRNIKNQLHLHQAHNTKITKKPPTPTKTICNCRAQH